MAERLLNILKKNRIVAESILPVSFQNMDPKILMTDFLLPY